MQSACNNLAIKLMIRKNTRSYIKFPCVQDFLSYYNRGIRYILFTVTVFNTLICSPMT